MTDKRIDLIRSRVRDIPDFPKPGIVFKDITPILSDPEAFSASIELLDERVRNTDVDVIVGIESRGFIFGGALAHKMAKRFVPARKPGKLPYKTIKVEYDLEYGTDALEIHEDAIAKGERVLIVDDLLATGGTAAGTAQLVEKLGGKVACVAFVIELGFLNGADKLKPYELVSLIPF